MDECSNATSLRLVARIRHGQGWMPDGIAEIVGHTDGRFLTLTVTRLIGARGAVEMRDFDCAVADACRHAVRAWLHAMALLEGASADQCVAAWAEDTARRFVPTEHAAQS